MQSISQQKIRVRFAPSPTGYLHVGSARAAIFNWLFAKKYGGTFLLRIEDTDVARSGEDMTRAIIEGMHWLGLDWNEEIVYQSKRLDIYGSVTQELIEKDKAYKCFCTKEELAEQREQARKEKRDYRYRNLRKCYKLSEQEKSVLEQNKKPYAVRLLLPDGETVFEDVVYGKIKVDHSQLDDFIIMRPDGFPTYHLAVVVDDHAMTITHVIRGDDHLSNTPKHIQIYNALGWSLPEFAHVPLILGPDKQKLSKRHGATAIGEYKAAGYLPEAMFNFLVLLGWSSGDDRELFNRSELIDAFSVDGISKKSAVFDEQKLEWMNGQYLNALSDTDFCKVMIEKLSEAGVLNSEFLNEKHDYLSVVASLIKPRVKLLSEIPAMTSYFFKDPEIYEEKAVRKNWNHPEQIERFYQLQQKLGQIRDFSVQEIENTMRGFAEELGVGPGKVIQPVRVAITGIAATPGMFEIMALLGKATVLRRMENAVRFLKERPGLTAGHQGE